MSTPDARRALVDAARQQWIRKLVDLSRRNNLLYFRQLKVGTLDLSSAPEDAMAELLQSHLPDAAPVKLADLVPRDALPAANGQLREVVQRAQSNFEERGLETMFLTLGMASWEAADGGRPTEAPVLLIPVTARPMGKAYSNWALQ